ncbi:hypothetical protein M8C21_001080 [Ambrosia artemisiifolia]|uniref:BSD domain-containing protein n=1 Tax=Ambrosia artemisiifolia TaxID=4212 RepID=A0AAD5G4Y6_AMBAR|nr:hypothetical protein M8C21_001080 [Ambrosia artemisiifolia]
MSNSDDPPHSPTKPDLSLFTQTITRQLHTVASFLAPPPSQPYSPPSTQLHNVSPNVSSSSIEGLKNDLAEIGYGFKTGLSLLSPNKAVTGISKFASNLIQFNQGDDDDDDDVVGITDDVVDFVREISTRPECWTDFPLSLQNQDFNMSHVQKDHALAIQELVPDLTTLRHTITNHMSEQHFWMIYFVLLVPRLNVDDYRLLSTPEKNTPAECSDDTHDEKGSVVSSTEQSENPLQDNATDRMKNKNSEDDVSFSDLDDETLSGIKQTQSCRFSSASENSDWVRLGGTSRANRSIHRERRSESEGSSSDWHAVEDVDL